MSKSVLEKQSLGDKNFSVDSTFPESKLYNAKFSSETEISENRISNRKISASEKFEASKLWQGAKRTALAEALELALGVRLKVAPVAPALAAQALVLDDSKFSCE